MMENKIKIGLIGFVVIIVIIGIWFVLSTPRYSERAPISDEQLKLCDSDSDCITVETICNWSDGSKVCCQTTINKEHENYWLENFIPEEGNCGLLIGGPHESYLKVPECIENKCVLSKFKPMAWFNCNRLLIPQNFEPPLEGPPYPINLYFYSLNKKGEHLLQIDDNMDFSSPLAEKTVESQMRSGEVFLDEGVYYWRVKDTNSGLWSDTCNLTVASHY